MSRKIYEVSVAIMSTPNASDYAELVAKNAIKALREPTDEMLDAGAIVEDGKYGLEDYNRAKAKARLSWQAMIDRLLK